MRRLTNAADRLLNRLVPASKAAAAPEKCEAMTWNWECSGGGSQSCTQSTDCSVVCTPCQA